MNQKQFGAYLGDYNQKQISSYEIGEAMVPLEVLFTLRAKGYPLEVVMGTTWKVSRGTNPHWKCLKLASTPPRLAHTNTLQQRGVWRRIIKTGTLPERSPGSVAQRYALL